MANSELLTKLHQGTVKSYAQNTIKQEDIPERMQMIRLRMGHVKRLTEKEGELD